MTESILTVNGEAIAFDSGRMGNLRDLIRSVGLDPARRGLAAAVNGHVVTADAWSGYKVTTGDRIDIVQPLAGG